MMETNKYIIEIPDNTAWLQWVKVSDKDGHVCFDFKDPEDLTPYEERAIGNCPDVAVCTQEAYQKGLNDAWEAARKIACDRVHGGFNIDTKLHIFGEADYAYILANYNAPEAVDKIQQYEQEQEERIDSDKNKVEALANDIGIHKLFALVKEIRGE